MQTRHWLVAVAASLLAVGTAHADPNLVTNGGFEQSSYGHNSEFGLQYGGQGVTGWTANDGFNLYFLGGKATTVGADTAFGSAGQDLYGSATFTGSSPAGGNFVALDGDVNARSQISQTISGLTVGDQYVLSFDWGAGQVQTRTGATTEQFQVSLGGQTFSTPVVSNPSQSFTGWFTQSFTYTATAGSEVLSFLSVGTPSGLPPIAVLDGVSLTQVPEPASVALLGVGLGVLGLVAQRRRSAAGSASA